MSTEAPGAISIGAPREAEATASGERGGTLARRGDGPSAADGPEPAQPGAGRRGLGEGRAPQALLAAVVAWMITVAPAGFGRGAPVSASVAASLAFLCGIAAPLLAASHRRAARHLGISVFLALVTLTWLLAAPSLQPSRLDPVRAAIGGIAWGLFALSWRDRWEVRRPPEPDPDVPLLQPRAHLPPLAAVIVAFGALVSLAILVLAWRVRDPDRALLAQAVAVACAVALITAASGVAVARGRRHTAGARRLTHRAVRQLLVLIVFAVLGAVVMMLR
ncbi:MULTISPECIES: hypothetical protein [Sorangium]|uniref:Uncharacterized protein n=1 Tax=Sorangium cellulosum TaxID=56 RepID=A0A4P2QMQ2_SORCE|nr:MULTISPECIES: hypothetical protein [Sorangium]AUX31128.1 hypothetical protein SOCE836_032470 [Sorangium cellulosum]WCQ90508.1 hypothetical protein NQZ70_03213 [Sorangium sp. Soce836]